MSTGLAAADANSMLDTWGAAAQFVQIHIGDPGVAGLANLSSVATREAVTWSAAAGGVKSMSNQPNWGNWAGTSPENITHLSFWTASTAGTFKGSLALVSPVTVTTGFPLQLSSQVISITPVAA